MPTTHQASEKSSANKSLASQVQKKTTSEKNNKVAIPNIQFKLTIGKSDDAYEQEADQIADKVMKMSTNKSVQRKCTGCEQEEKIHRKPLVASIQKKGNNSDMVASDSVTNKINSTRGGGSKMDESTNSFMADRFGTDFSNVKIHTGDYAVQMSKELNAQAFTVGSDIYFNSGKYNPESNSGKHLLAHELVHTVQQVGGISKKGMTTKGSPGFYKVTADALWFNLDWPVGKKNAIGGTGKSSNGSFLIYKGDTVDVVSQKDNEWLEVTHKGLRGFVSSNYLVPANVLASNPSTNFAGHEKITIGFWGALQDWVAPNSTWGKKLKQNADMIFGSLDSNSAFLYILSKIRNKKIKHLDIKIFGYSWGGWSALQLTQILYECLDLKEQRQGIEHFTIKVGMLDPVNSLRINSSLPINSNVKALSIYQKNGCYSGCVGFSSTYKGEEIAGAINKNVSNDGIKKGHNRNGVPKESTPDHIDLGYLGYGNYDQEIITWVISG
jgi:hypothetical protein